MLSRDWHLPFDDRGGPGEAGTEGNQQDQVSRPNDPARYGFRQRDWNRRPGRVPVALHVCNELVLVSAETLHQRVNNAPVGLMWDDAVDLCNVQSAAIKRFERGGMHSVDGMLEHVASVHPQEVLPGSDRAHAGGLATAAARHK